MPVEVETQDVFEKVVFSRSIIDDEASMNDLTLSSGRHLRAVYFWTRISLDELNAATCRIVYHESSRSVAWTAYLANLDVA